MEALFVSIPGDFLVYGVFSSSVNYSTIPTRMFKKIFWANSDLLKKHRKAKAKVFLDFYDSNSDLWMRIIAQNLVSTKIKRSKNMRCCIFSLEIWYSFVFQVLNGKNTVLKIKKNFLYRTQEKIYFASSFCIIGELAESLKLPSGDRWCFLNKWVWKTIYQRFVNKLFKAERPSLFENWMTKMKKHSVYDIFVSMTKRSKKIVTR